MIEMTLEDTLSRYYKMFKAKNEKFINRLFNFFDEYKKVNRVKGNEVLCKDLINYVAVVDFENKIYFIGD